MSINITYPYTEDLNYTFDSDKIEIINGKAQLKLQQDDVDFNEDFADDIDFIYDNTKAEFTGGLVRQKDQRPSNATFYASFTNNINGSWGNGILTGTAIGGASVSGGKLDLSFADVRYVNYNADLNADSQQVGCVRFRWIPDYSGYPSFVTSLHPFSISKDNNDIKNLITVSHLNTGQINLSIYNSAGIAIINQDLGLWGPNSGTTYEFELNWDITSGATRLFLNGTQFGATQTATGIRDSNIGLFRVGSNYTATRISEFKIEDILIFSTVQHTSDYTPDWTGIKEYIYLENFVVLPEMEHTGDGSILDFNSLITTQVGNPRILLEIGRSGNKLYWDGNSWSVSNETYIQSTTLADFNANCDNLPVTGEKYGQFTIVFPDSNIISSIADLTANMLINIGYLTTNPTIETNTSFRSDGLETFTETSTKIGNDQIKHILKKNGNYYYWNGIAWVISNETYTQSNTAIEIETNKTNFLTEGVGKYIKIKSFLHSDDGSTTPLLDNLIINYNFSGETLVLTEVVIYGYLRDIVDALENETIKVRSHWILGDKSIITGSIYSYTTYADGYFEITFNYEDVPPDYLEWRIKNKIYKTNFLEQDYVKFGELTILWQNTLNIDLLGL